MRRFGMMRREIVRQKVHLGLSDVDAEFAVIDSASGGAAGARAVIAFAKPPHGAQCDRIWRPLRKMPAVPCVCLYPRGRKGDGLPELWKSDR